MGTRRPSDHPLVHQIDFLVELADRYGELRDISIGERTKSYWRGIDMCRFHVHEDKDCKGRYVNEAKEKRK